MITQEKMLRSFIKFSNSFFKNRKYIEVSLENLYVDIGT